MPKTHDPAAAGRHQRDDQAVRGRHLGGNEGRLQCLQAVAGLQSRLVRLDLLRSDTRRSASARPSSASRKNKPPKAHWGDATDVWSVHRRSAPSPAIEDNDSTFRTSRCRDRRHPQGLRRHRRAGRCVVRGSRPAASMRCSAKTVLASRRWSSCCPGWCGPSEGRIRVFGEEVAYGAPARCPSSLACRRPSRR